MSTQIYSDNVSMCLNKVSGISQMMKLETRTSKFVTFSVIVEKRKENYRTMQRSISFQTEGGPVDPTVLTLQYCSQSAPRTQNPQI